ncbi:hypothetical protein [Halosimplex amylolyticum]|uniref:hypothetical protein n=1 Tax=Halosimplex amylolyticum TaxID=3396616 RepID=UPI003F567C65
MSESQTRTAPDRTDALFDRYALPKAALTVILAASLVGTWVTTRLAGDASAALTAAKWAYFVALGVLTGGLVWKHVFVRPADLGDGAADYCAEMYDRFDRIAVGAIAVLATGGAVVLRAYLDAFGRAPPVYAFAALLAVWLAVAAATTRRDVGVTDQFRSPGGLVALALALAVVAATAVAEVAVRGLDPVAAGVRVLHLLAFAAWIGGAVWNIFVAVPTGRKRPTIPVVRAAGEQLERFRWAVRFVIPTLFLTGLYQAVDGLGTTVATYLGSAVGLAVLAKIGFVGLLVVIFTLCPMWRACSPIEGVCELEDLGGDGAAQSRSNDRQPVGDGPEGTSDD